MMYPDIELPSIKWGPFVDLVMDLARVRTWMSDDFDNLNSIKRKVAVELQGKLFWIKNYSYRDFARMPIDQFKQEVQEQVNKAWDQFLNEQDWNLYWVIADGK